MPTRRKTTRRKPKKKTYKKKMTVSKGIAGLFGSASHIRKMKYTERITLTPVSGIIQHYVYSANGIYDSNITGTGHQVRWYDQISPYFNHYCVLSSKISANFTHTGNVTTSSPYMCLVTLRDTPTTAATRNDLMENGLCAYKNLPHSSDSIVNLTKGFNARTFFGKKFVSDNYDLKGSGSNPQEQAYYHITIDPHASSGDAAIAVSISIEYLVKWSEPVPAPVS